MQFHCDVVCATEATPHEYHHTAGLHLFARRLQSAKMIREKV